MLHPKPTRGRQEWCGTVPDEQPVIRPRTVTPGATEDARLASALWAAGRWGARHVAATVVSSDGVLATMGDDSQSFALASVTKLLLAYAALVAIEEGTTSPANAAGTFACTNFTPSGGALVSNTLAWLGTNTASFAGGVGTWAPTGSGQTRDFRFAYSFSSSAPDTVQSSSASVSFVWEARSS